MLQTFVVVSGGSLLEYMGLVGQLPWLQAVHYLKQMTDAVCFLHSKRVVYLNWQSKYFLDRTY